LLGFSFSALSASGAPIADSTQRRQLVAEVREGRRHEARVSWWGFDAHDSTEFLQEAINSKVKRLIVDRQSSPWVTRPLTGVSGQEIVFENGTELVALEGAYKAQGDCLLSFARCEGVIIRGEEGHAGELPVIRMRKEDYQSTSYDKSEWRHGLAFLGCRAVRVEDLRIEKTGGDGIYLGTGSDLIAIKSVRARWLTVSTAFP
jgi:hypothetical protein